MDLMNMIRKALQGGEYGRGGTTGGMGAQRSANPGPMGAGDIPDPSLYEQTPYLVPTGGDTGLPDDFYKDPNGPAMKRSLMSAVHDDSGYGSAQEISISDIFAGYLDSGLELEDALRAAFVDAAKMTAENSMAHDRAAPTAASRRVDEKRYGKE